MRREDLGVTWEEFADDLLSRHRLGFDLLLHLLGLSNGLGASRDHHPGNAEQLRE
jgi:hypothetical protein